MSHIFISYSRKDVDFAQEIVDALAANDLDTWIDWKSIPKGEDWEQEIYRGIEEADAFLFLISLDSVASPMCNKEIAHAVKNGKRILPIVIRDTDPKIIHPEISKRNWIFCREGQDDFNKAIEEIRKTIHTDYEWLKYHTQLQNKALAWERAKKDTSRLLRGKELREVEEQLVNVGSQKNPQPTDLHRNYLLASQRNEVHQRRQVSIVLSIGLAIVAVLAVFAWVQRNTALTEANSRATAESNAIFEANAKATALVNEENARATAQAEKERAEEQARIARSRELTTLARAEFQTHLNLSFLLSVSAFDIYDNYQTRGVLLDSLRVSPRLRRFLFGNKDSSVEGIAFSPDGKTLASANDDGTIILWDVASDQQIGQPLRGHAMSVTDVAFSPDGKVLASASQDQTIILWDLSKNPPTRRTQLIGHSDFVWGVAFSPDGKLLASASADNTVILWNLDSPHPIGEVLKGHSGFVWSVAFSPDGKTLASASSDKTIILWNVATHQPMGEPLRTNAGLVSIAFSPNGKTLASGGCASIENNSCSQGGVYVWNITNHLLIGQPMISQAGPIMSIAYNPEGTILASGNYDGTIGLWDVVSHQSIGPPLTGHSKFVNSVAFSPDGKTLASGSYDSSIALWNIDNRESISQILTKNNGKVRSVAFSPDGKTLAAGKCIKLDGSGACIQEDIILWDVSSHQPIGQPLHGHTGTVQSIAFSPDGRLLASGGYDKTIILWEVASHIPIGQPLTGHSDAVNSVAFDPRGKILASASSDTTIILWDVASHRPIGRPLTGHTNLVRGMAFSPDGNILATAGWDGSVILWDVTNHKIIGQPFHNYNSEIFSIAFSPDGKLLAIGIWDGNGTILLWDTVTRQVVGEPLASHQGGIKSVAFSPDGKILASAGASTRVTLWDIASHQPMGQSLAGNTDVVNDVAFSPDGKILASSGDDGNVFLWDVSPESWIKHVCEIVGRNFTQAEWTQYFPGESYRITCPQYTAGE